MHIDALMNNTYIAIFFLKLKELNLSGREDLMVIVKKRSRNQLSVSHWPTGYQKFANKNKSLL